jgi:hypothetical protein
MRKGVLLNERGEETQGGKSQRLFSFLFSQSKANLLEKLHFCFCDFLTDDILGSPGIAVIDHELA